MKDNVGSLFKIFKFPELIKESFSLVYFHYVPLFYLQLKFGNMPTFPVILSAKERKKENFFIHKLGNKIILFEYSLLKENTTSYKHTNSKP